MPPISYIIARCYLRDAEVPPNDAEAILKRQIADASRVKVPHEEVERWLEAGRIAQQLEYAEFEENPEWQALWEKFGKPGRRERPNTVPVDPEERKRWEAEMARKQGWR